MRIVRVTVLGLSCTLGLIVVVLMPDLVWYVPSRIRDNWALAVALSCLMAYAIVRRLAATEPEGRTLGAWAGAGLKRLDTCTDWVLRQGMALALGVLCLGLLLVWVPHYLVWPWARDHETFAVLAQSWEEGILPYRDIRAYNFPGAIYIAWVLGKVFGWGHTVPLHAFDAGCVVVLGLVLAVWSRRRLGGAIPGLIGYLAFLAYYLGQPFDIVAQRDWHTALLVCLGLLVMQARPGRSTRLASALAAALALTIRPHAVLFLPALAWEAAQEVDARAPGRFRGIRGVAVWCLWFGIFVAMASAPLLLAGIADDLVRGLRIAAYGGPYSRATAANALHSFAEQFELWRIDVPLIATLLLAVHRPSRLTGIAKTWSAAWLGALLYQPIHPVHHFYLFLPIVLVSSITWAFVVFWLLSSQRLARPVLVLAIALLAYEIMPESPGMCSLTASIGALRPLLSGEIPIKPPIGCFRPFPGYQSGNSRWTSYREVLIYIRSQTGPRTLVANVINTYPYEPLNGPSGRLSPFLAESGICWMTQVNVDLDAEFARSLLNSIDSVVVWDPSQTGAEPRLALKGLMAVIRQNYEPAARFGRHEVWRRRRLKQE